MIEKTAYKSRGARKVFKNLGPEKKPARIEKRFRPMEDAIFKFIIHKRWVLAWLLKDNIEELVGMSIEEIERCFEPIGDNTLVKGRETEYFTSDGEKIIFDSVFDLHIPTSDGEIIIKVEIEGQRNPRPGYPLEKRAQYYLASLVSAQKGTEFTGKNYGDVRKAYSIWLILEPISRDKNSRDVYQFDVKHSYGDKDHVPAHLTCSI